MSQARTGTITQLAKDRWRLQVTPEPDPLTGPRKRLSKTVTGTQTEARHALQRLIGEAGARLAAETNTIASLLDAYMATATLAATTRTDWQSLIDRHINPDIGMIRLDRLRSRDCDEFYTRLRALGLGPSRVRCAHVVLLVSVESGAALFTGVFAMFGECGRGMARADRRTRLHPGARRARHRSHRGKPDDSQRRNEPPSCALPRLPVLRRPRLLPRQHHETRSITAPRRRTQTMPAANRDRDARTRHRNDTTSHQLHRAS